MLTSRAQAEGDDVEHPRIEQRSFSTHSAGHGFFVQDYAARADEPQPPQPPPPVWVQPDAVLGTSVAHRLILVHTDDVAVAVTGLTAYPNGFEFTVRVVLREEPRDGVVFGRGFHRPFTTGPVPDDFLRLGVQFADGSSATNLGPPFAALPASGAPPQRPLLSPGGGGGGGRRYDMQHWVWPLPPPGPVDFVCEWPSRHITESRAQLDGQIIVDAAGQCVELWPDGTAPD